MPYFFLFENLPAERPVGPLQGFYEAAKAAVRISEDSDASDRAAGSAGGCAGFWLRLSPRSDNLDQAVIVDIGQILREAGFLEIVCHYDGGNDEGFAFFDSAATADGSFTLKEMIDRLCGTRLESPTTIRVGLRRSSIRTSTVTRSLGNRKRPKHGGLKSGSIGSSKMSQWLCWAKDSEPANMR